MLDLESMIKHYKEVAKEQAELYECYMQHGEQGDYVNECLKCAEEHRQLAEWLKELKLLREQTRWIPVNERLPKEHEWVGTKAFGTTISNEVYVTFESPEGERFTKHLSFQNGKMSNYVQRKIDAICKGSIPIAWMPEPEPYKAESEE